MAPIGLSRIELAHIAVKRALRRGELERRPCLVCGTTVNVIAHHDDYLRPLDVRWFCQTHHYAWHRAHGPGLNHDARREPLELHRCRRCGQRGHNRVTCENLSVSEAS